ncbi:putative phage SPO1 DNA polymerase-related protein, uracil-DNA glycosylase family [Sterolibacterium denitrificans]|uniref:Type-4 uracil-DNA glycosylase n=2 Tax=Sterolibacterium denitrificans TaxID=157592 RepID=A0A656Z7S8_9PROT|nr:uracil-DNA glycosylase [Sterolibacterium denitrificans]KYC29119.1 hypothetical protein ACY05_00625 [Sterolibacterium denitrificans]SMB29068.1 putative phage SPO1 DNA polymerase-related protein, uracil-DNA glycosylase family [Sterolibacterium denitrificans]
MSKTSSPASRRAAMLREMGLAPLWKLRQPSAQASGESADAPQVDAPAPAQAVPQVQVAAEPTTATASGDERASAIAVMDWAQLRASVAACRACDLCKDRQQAVLGVGDETADWLFVGEGPGAEEDRRGEPFVGQAGKLLDAMLAAIGLQRGRDVYIANAVKCRPAGNRTPTAEEMAACRPYLERQIALLQPRLIVALGRPAAQTLLQSEIKISAARGRLFDRAGIPVVITYHPAYLLRTLNDKAKAWEDLCFARRTMAGLKLK